jgi:hypothetical protein
VGPQAIKPMMARISMYALPRAPGSELHFLRGKYRMD